MIYGILYASLLYIDFEKMHKGMSHLKIAAIQTVRCFCDHRFCSMILNLMERNSLCVRTVTDI